MNKTAKYILYGVGTFALCILALIVGRSLIKGKEIKDTLGDPWNWIIAAVCGVTGAVSLWNKNKKKEDNNNKQ